MRATSSRKLLRERRVGPPPGAQVDAVRDARGVEVGGGQSAGAVSQHGKRVQVGVREVPFDRGGPLAAEVSDVGRQLDGVDAVALGDPVDEPLDVLVTTAVQPSTRRQSASAPSS